MIMLSQFNLVLPKRAVSALLDDAFNVTCAVQDPEF
jgi:hypothetical protein